MSCDVLIYTCIQSENKRNYSKNIITGNQED